LPSTPLAHVVPYTELGTSDFDQAKATFISIGYLPTKTLTGADGLQFYPALFARAYLTLDVVKECSYLYADTTFITEREPSRPSCSTQTLAQRYGRSSTCRGWNSGWAAWMCGTRK
jgi:hypothetical protein